MRDNKLHKRIRLHWRPGIGYHELMRLVFPEREYPKAWRYSMNGGPPGCAMSFGKALRELGLGRYSGRSGGQNVVLGALKPEG